MKKFIHLFLYLLLTGTLFAQTGGSVDSTLINEKQEKIYIPKDSVGIADSLRREKIRRVTRHSAFVPGWGQIDNKQAWKVPIIYGALGITTYVFFNNLSTYRELRQAYIYITDTIPGNDDLIPERYRLSPNSIRFYRDEFRKNIDYSVIAFLVMWGLNVVDATVFANLKDFDVSDDISLRIKTPAYNPINGSAQIGISLNLKPPAKQLKNIPAR